MASIIATLAQKTLAGTAEVLISQEHLGIASLHVKAPSSNAGSIYFGDADVASDRNILELAPGQEADISGVMVCGTLDEIDASSLYVLGTASDVVTIGYMKRSN